MILTNPEIKDSVGIVVCTQTDLFGSDNVKEVLYGIEEEQVPFELWAQSLISEDLASIAHAAAARSIFNIGICCSNDVIIIHHCKLLKTKPLFYLSGDQCNSKNARYIGNNAARMVKGAPFFDIM